MKNIGNFVCKNKVMILVISILLLIPTLIGIKLTEINYDILVYLPEDIETIKGQEILTDDFNMGAFSTIILNNMNSKDVLNLEDDIKLINGVEKVVSVYDVTGSTIPIEFLPSDVVDKVKQDESTIMLVTFEGSTSSSKTLDAVAEIRELVDDNVGGMSAMALDTMDLSEQEIAIYIVIAVILCIVVLMISLDSYLVPVLLLLNIGIAILYNLGTNIFLGDISYITKAISSVLQLGVTTDFSIFLYHKYEKTKGKYKDKEKAMSEAINETLVSVFGSSLTTIAGFLALCTMNLTLGKDIGIVMAKGVFIGLICVIILFPVLLLLFDKKIEKTKHKVILPEFNGIKNCVMKHYKLFFIIFLIILIPAWYGNKNVDIYYNLDKSLPSDLECILANEELKEKFNIVSPEIVLIDKDMKVNDLKEMTSKIEEIDGIDLVLSSSKLAELGITENMVSDDFKGIYENDEYQMVLINSTYGIATDELNDQIGKVDNIVKSYDDDAIVAGEGPLMKDLVTISNQDFKNVTYASLIVIFVIMAFVLKSISLPVILVTVIEFAIFINMSVPFYTGDVIPFISSIVIGTIQLGATIDYAILMTTKFIEERKNGNDKFKAVSKALDSSVSSIIVSGMCFFAATFGVGVYSKLEMIGSLCSLISRGALISVIVVITILPSFLIIFDGLICKTTKGLNRKGFDKMKKVGMFLIIGSLFVTPVNALTKEETVYSKLNYDGSINKTLVNEHLISDEDKINDVSNLKNILNINGDENAQITDNNLVWENNGNDIFYQGETEEDLPVGLDISYKLNGEEKSLDNILGSSGTVSITFNYVNNDSHSVYVNGKTEVLYTPFVVTLGTIIPMEDSSNISVTNGKIIANGLNNIVVGLATPGLSDSLGISEIEDMNSITLTYDTDSFKLNTIYNVITPKIIDSSDLDVFDKLDDVYSKTYELSNASEQLVAGSNQLFTGITSFNSQFNQYNLGVNQLYLGSKDLVNGYKEIYNGISELNAKVNSLTTLVTAINDLNTGINTLKTNSTALKGGSDVVIPGTITVLNSNISTIDNSITEIDNNISLLEASKEGKTDEEKATIDGQIATLLGTKTALEAQKTDINSLIIGLGTIKDGITGMDTGILELQTGSNTLVESIGELPLLVSGVNDLNDGSELFNTGLNQLYGSISTINGYSNKLNSGSGDILEGMVTLNDGVVTFNNEGIQTLANYINVDLKRSSNVIEELVNLGEEYNTFTMKSDDTESTTKFVLVIDSKEKEEEKEEIIEEVEEESLWTKIINFFRK